MKIAFYDTHNFDKNAFAKELENSEFELHFFNQHLNLQNIQSCSGYDAVCLFVNDKICAQSAAIMAQLHCKAIFLRCAGFNNIDLEACKKHSIQVYRVPEYSPYAVAEYAVALLLTLNRKTHRAFNRTREANFSIDGLLGFDLHNKNVGIVGTGKIGSIMCKIMLGFGAKVFAYDKEQNKELAATGVKYVSFDDLLQQADIISLHIPLNKESLHIIDDSAFAKMKNGVMLINTGRGALIETKALIKNLKNAKISGAGLDVYEEEENYFFQDHSEDIMQDDLLARLISFPNVLLSSHQAFLTHEALQNIAQTSFKNMLAFKNKTSTSTQLV